MPEPLVPSPTLNRISLPTLRFGESPGIHAAERDSTGIEDNFRRFFCPSIPPCEPALQLRGEMLSGLVEVKRLLRHVQPDGGPALGNPSHEHALSSRSFGGVNPHETRRYSRLECFFYLEDFPTLKKTLRDLTSCLNPSGELKLSVLTLSGERSGDYLLQRRLKDAGVYLPLLHEFEETLHSLSLREVVTHKLSFSLDFGEAFCGRRPNPKGESVRLVMVLVSGRRME